MEQERFKNMNIIQRDLLPMEYLTDMEEKEVQEEYESLI